MKEQTRYRYMEHVEEDGIHLHLMKFKKISETKCGAWFQRVHINPFLGEEILIGKKRFILSGYGKRYCYETKEKALESYISRKKSQKLIATNALEISSFMLDKLSKDIELKDDDIIFDAEHITSKYLFI